MLQMSVLSAVVKLNAQLANCAFNSRMTDAAWGQGVTVGVACYVSFQHLLRGTWIQPLFEDRQPRLSTLHDIVIEQNL